MTGGSHDCLIVGDHSTPEASIRTRSSNSETDKPPGVGSRLDALAPEQPPGVEAPAAVSQSLSTRSAEVHYKEIPPAKLEAYATSIAGMATNRPGSYDELRQLLNTAGRTGGPQAIRELEEATNKMLANTDYRFATSHKDGEHYEAGFFNMKNGTNTGTGFNIRLAPTRCRS